MLKIISGGQTGVDRGALDAARELGLESGGWCPAGRLAEDGRIPEGYALREMPTHEYAARTAANVRDSDGTLLICKGEPSGGTRATLEFCRRFGKPHLLIDYEQTAIEDGIRLALRFARSLTTLNVAGPRASQWPQGRGVAHQIIAAVLRRLSGHEGGDEYSEEDSPRGEF